MTPRDRIAVLLHHYRDVCEGIPGTLPPGDDLLALMCREWNHPSYQQLERLLGAMHERWPMLRQALRVRYERYTERRVAWCPVCKQTEPATKIGGSHLRGHVAGAKRVCRIGAKAPDMQARVVRVYGLDDNPVAVGDALEWLERRWLGEVDLPPTILQHQSGELLRVAA